MIGRDQRRALPAAAAWCAAIALLGLGLDWRTAVTAAGRTVTTGFGAVSVAVPVIGVLTLVLLVFTWLDPDRVAASGAAASGAAIAALICVFGGPDTSGAAHAGAGVWISAFGFGTAALLAAIVRLTR